MRRIHHCKQRMGTIHHSGSMGGGKEPNTTLLSVRRHLVVKATVSVEQLCKFLSMRTHMFCLETLDLVIFPAANLQLHFHPLLFTRKVD